MISIVQRRRRSWLWNQTDLSPKLVRPTFYYLDNIEQIRTPKPQFPHVQKELNESNESPYLLSGCHPCHSAVGS